MSHDNDKKTELLLSPSELCEVPVPLDNMVNVYSILEFDS